ncbi:hypothetical protein D3C76_1510030 [compost metagenome]
MSWVFIPRALMDTTRHQRDSSLTPPCTAGAIQPVLLMHARIRKPTANHGSSGGRLPVGSAPCIRVIMAAVTITGSSMATRMSFTTVAVSPVSVDML